MAFALVQDSGRVAGTNSINLSLASLPMPGNALFVKIGMSSGNSGESPSITDNQGNMWHVAVTSAFASAARVKIAYLWNVPASSGTFTVTVARITGSTMGVQGNLEEWSGFGTNDPFSAAHSNTGFNTRSLSTGTTAAIGELDGLVMSVACLFLFNQTITVESVTPAWTQAWEGLSGLRAEADYRIVTGGGTQICHWSIGSNDDYAACIAAFVSGNTPTAGVRTNQTVQTVAAVQLPSPLRANQEVQSIVAQSAPLLRWNQVVLTYVVVQSFPPPPGVAGCPAALPLAPVTGRPGCDDSLS